MDAAKKNFCIGMGLSFLSVVLLAWMFPGGFAVITGDWSEGGADASAMMAGEAKLAPAPELPKSAAGFVAETLHNGGTKGSALTVFRAPSGKPCLRCDEAEFVAWSPERDQALMRDVKGGFFLIGFQTLAGGKTSHALVRLTASGDQASFSNGGLAVTVADAEGLKHSFRVDALPFGQGGLALAREE